MLLDIFFNKKVVWGALFWLQPFLFVSYHLFTLHYPLLRELFPADLRNEFANSYGAIDAIWIVGAFISLTFCYIMLLISFAISKYWKLFKIITCTVPIIICLFVVYVIYFHNPLHPVFVTFDIIFKTIPFVWLNYFLLKKLLVSGKQYN